MVRSYLSVKRFLLNRDENNQDLAEKSMLPVDDLTIENQFKHVEESLINLSKMINSAYASSPGASQDQPKTVSP